MIRARSVIFIWFMAVSLIFLSILPAEAKTYSYSSNGVYISVNAYEPTGTIYAKFKVALTTSKNIHSKVVLELQGRKYNPGPDGPIYSLEWRTYKFGLKDSGSFHHLCASENSGLLSGNQYRTATHLSVYDANGKRLFYYTHPSNWKHADCDAVPDGK